MRGSGERRTMVGAGICADPPGLVQGDVIECRGGFVCTPRLGAGVLESPWITHSLLEGACCMITGNPSLLLIDSCRMLQPNFSFPHILHRMLFTEVSQVPPVFV